MKIFRATFLRSSPPRPHRNIPLPTWACVRWFWPVVAFVAASVAWAELGRSEDPFQIRVVCYNTHHGAGVDGKLDLARIAEVIKSAKADIVALQEVDKKTKRTGQVDQGLELARLTELSYLAFGQNIKLQGGGYGNAILSRWPIVKPQNHKLPNYRSGEQRGVLQTQLLIERGTQTRTIDFLSTHFDHRQDDTERFQSAMYLNQLREKLAGPAILAGDFNDVVGSRTLNELEKKWEPANSTPLKTIPVDRPTRQIDFIFFAPKDKWEVVKVKVLSEKIASDHRAILAILKSK